LRPRRPPIISSALLALALPLAGCGSRSSSSSNASSNEGHPDQAQMQQRAVEFSGCMRTHGAADFPDPSDGREFKMALDPETAHSQAFRSAYAACRHLLPNDGRPSKQAPRSQAQIAEIVAFARCIRGQGFHSFPDPTSSGELTHQMLASAGIDVHQPGLEQAADDCASLTHGLITKTIIARFVAGG
jgi:hypothetical protein